MGWDDRFKYGMHKGRTVREVFNYHPSYLVWSALKASKKFTPAISGELLRLCIGPPKLKFGPASLLKEYIDKMGGPW